MEETLVFYILRFALAISIDKLLNIHPNAFTHNLKRAEGDY
jgi:hypothetical protein